MILLDATAFALLVNKNAKPPWNPETRAHVPRSAERFKFLEAEVQRNKDTIVIPSPALAEVLVRLEDEAGAVLERISRSAFFKVVDFDTLAAIEVAAMTREAIRAGDKKAGSQAVWQKVKMDRQIIAIGRVMNVKTIYSDDTGVGTFAAMLGIPVVRTWEMPLPPQDPQAGLFDAENIDEELLAEAAAPTAEEQ